MSSLTQQRKKIEKRKNTAMGQSRKKESAAGSTPRFPVHPEQDPSAVLPQPPGTHPGEK